LVKVSDPSVIVETVKAAEDEGSAEAAKGGVKRGVGTVLRLYESLGKEITVSVDTRIPHGFVYAADMLENRKTLSETPVDLSNLRFGPFEIKTLLLQEL
jgi:alpha-mannosidase